MLRYISRVMVQTILLPSFFQLVWLLWRVIVFFSLSSVVVNGYHTVVWGLAPKPQIAAITALAPSMARRTSKFPQFALSLDDFLALC